MLAIPIELIVLALVALGGSLLAAITGKANTGWIPTWLKSAVFFAKPLFEVATICAKWLSHKYGEAYFNAEVRVVKWFAQLAHYQYVVGYWSLLWPPALYRFGERLLRHEVPTAINARTKPLAQRIDAAEAAAKAAAGYSHSFPKKIHAVDRTKDVTRIERVAMPHAAEWDWIHDHYGELQRVVRTAATDAVAGTLPHSVTWPSWRGYTMKQLRRLWRERNYILGATGAAVIVARAIGGVTPRCVKKGPIGKVARALCGIPTHLLNDLLGILADVWILQNVCVLLPYLETAAKDIGTPLVAGLTEVGAGLCKGNKAPAALVGPMPSIPTLVFGVTASGV